MAIEEQVSALRPGTDPLGILRQVFGYGDFRGRQREIIDRVMGGGDALVLMPTGGGKSVCYQVPALCRTGTAVVVSPLIALMRDQVEALRAAGVRAAYLNSSLDEGDARAVRRELAAGRLDLIYAAPERVVLPSFLEALGQIRISLFAIDECHLVSIWGHDFRPEYIQLDVLADLFPRVPRIALTATADARTRDDIRRRLRLEGAPVYVSSFDRPNISYEIVVKDNPKRQLLNFLSRHSGHSGIIYCLSRSKVDEMADWLRKSGWPALPYHAGLSPAVRQENQDRFLKEDSLIMVATVAFGMGIDKPDVRFVVHLDLPGSMEAYYQETGRAGRDGLPSEAWMAYGMSDAAQRRRMIGEGDSPDDVKRVEHSKLDALLGLCEGADCRRRVILGYFGEETDGKCGNCDNCRNPPPTWDGTESARKALSAIYRTGQRFGVNHVIDVLIGSRTEKIEHFGHDALPTFGVGKDLDRGEWRSVLRQLLAAGRISVDHGSHGALHLTETARPLLRGEEKIILKRDPSATTTRALRSALRPKRGADGEAPLVPDLSDDGRRLFQALRQVRKRLAEVSSVPPYIICHDTTMLEMARQRPRTRDDLLRIPGMGAAKIEKYGSAFLDVIALDGRAEAV